VWLGRRALAQDVLVQSHRSGTVPASARTSGFSLVPTRALAGPIGAVAKKMFARFG